MSEKCRVIDPAIFGEDQSIEFDLELASQTERFVSATEILDKYNPDGSPKSSDQLGGTIGGLINKFGSETGDQISLQAGSFTVTAIGDESGESKTFTLEELSAEEYQQATSNREAAAEMLVEYAIGYQEHAQAQLEEIVGPTEAPEKAWEIVWKRLQNTIRSMGGGNLADVADFFDELVELKYPKTYDPMDAQRGKEARQDTAAKTFYTVMQPHLKRAIQRRGEDNWS